GELGEAAGHLVVVTIEAVVAPVQPDLVVAAVAPARGRGGRDLEGIALVDHLGGGAGDDLPLSAGVQLAEDMAEELGPLEPPVTEELGVEGGGDRRRAIEPRPQAVELAQTGVDEVSGVRARLRGGVRGIVPVL